MRAPLQRRAEARAMPARPAPRPAPRAPHPALIHAVLQRKCAGGAKTSAGRCANCDEERPGLQRKLALGASTDALEREADRIAELVASGPASPGSASSAPRIQRLAAAPAQAAGEVPASVERVLGGAGSPIDQATRRTMETRLGHDFSGVRVHRGGGADRSARDIGALAYTAGNHIVFADGHYAPGSPAGTRLLAHELVHVVQQAGAPPLVQRACGPAALGAPAPDCAASDQDFPGWQFRFKVNCDELMPGEEAKLASLRPGSANEVHGYASKEGPAPFNRDLSCHRANRIAGLIAAKRPDCTVTGRFRHGGSPASVPGMPVDANPPGFWRSVLVRDTMPAAGPENICGPDATQWFVAQVGAAKRDPRVLDVAGALTLANMYARALGTKPMLDAMEILEGKLVGMTADAWLRAGKPRHTADANAQLQQPSAVLGTLEFQTTVAMALTANYDAIWTLLSLRDAALGWKALVGHGAPYDFKVDSATMLDPKSASCPRQCARTVTLCPGNPGANCFENDLPGNVFYALIGAYVGFSENALQLGSQYAQLTSPGKQPKHWDPPADTAMISFGYSLPGRLTAASFCAALQGAKGSFQTHNCLPCTEPPTGIAIK